MTKPPHGHQAQKVSAESDEPTVEGAVRAHLSAQLGGPRGMVETALPIALFTTIYVVTDELRAAVVVAVLAALVMTAARLVQRSPLQAVSKGLIGIVVASVIAMGTGSAEAAFLPGIVWGMVTGGWLAASIILGWPLMGFLIGSVLGDPTGWRRDPGMMKLANRLTLVFLVPVVIRVGVQYPLYLAGEVGWLGVSRVALGAPLFLASFLAAAAILARGRTPLQAG